MPDGIKTPEFNSSFKKSESHSLSVSASEVIKSPKITKIQSIRPDRPKSSCRTNQQTITKKQQPEIRLEVPNLKVHQTKQWASTICIYDKNAGKARSIEQPKFRRTRYIPRLHTVTTTQMQSFPRVWASAPEEGRRAEWSRIQKALDKVSNMRFTKRVEERTRCDFYLEIWTSRSTLKISLSPSIHC